MASKKKAPSVAEMERALSMLLDDAAGKKKKAKAPCRYGARLATGLCPKAPCKYGPRDEEGKCPTKKSSASATGTKSAASSGTVKVGKPTSKPLTERELRNITSTTTKIVDLGLKTQKGQEVAGEIAKGAGAAAKVLKGVPIKTVAAGGTAAAVGAGLTVAVAGAIAAYAGIKAGLWLRDKWDWFSNPQNSINAKFKEAERLYKAAKVELEIRWGRKLTEAEDHMLYVEFMTPIEKLMPKGGFK